MTQRPTHLALMRYADGESDPDEVREVEAWLGGSEARWRELDAVKVVGRAVRAWSDSRARDFDVADRVMDRIAALDAGQSSATSRSEPSKILAHIGPKVVPLFGTAVALAAAAAVALVVMPRGGESGARVASSGAPATASPSPELEGPAPADAPVDAPGGAEIQSIEFGGGGGSIFLVQSGVEATPVVWLMDEPPAVGGRMEPL